MLVLEITDVSKRFLIPSARRETVREHLFGLLRPRHFESLQVLDRVSLCLEPGEALGIMGRNGSGKSTLLKIIAGIYPPDAGRVARHAPMTPLLELGVGWNPELDAIDNVFLIGSVLGLSLREIESSMDEILDFAELASFAHLKLKYFSTGMASRLAYAVAFQAVRDVLILDEIFAVGDFGFKQRCQERYRELHAAGHAILLVSHDPAIIADHCDRALLLDGGRILLDDTPHEVAQAYQNLLSRDGRESGS